MINEFLKDLKAFEEVLLHPLSSERSIEVADAELDFSTPGLASRWELSFVKNTEGHVYERIYSEISEDDIFFDVGANLGFYTCLISKKASKVYSFEPNPVAGDLLEKNIRKNQADNAETLKVALSDEDASKGFKNLFAGSVIGWGTVKDSETDGERIQARRASTLLEKSRIEIPDLIKIDVEGHEIEVLNGMKKILEKGSPTVYVESHHNHDELEKILEEYGYEHEKLNRRVEGNIFYKAQPK